jgi:hypothetical protein
MASRGPLSAAHKAAISAGLKRYWASRKGSGGGGASAGSPGTGKPRESVTRGLRQPKAAVRSSQNIDTGKQISRAAAAAIMFGPGGTRKKAASGKRPKKRR